MNTDPAWLPAFRSSVWEALTEGAGEDEQTIHDLTDTIMGRLLAQLPPIPPAVTVAGFVVGFHDVATDDLVIDSCQADHVETQLDDARAAASGWDGPMQVYALVPMPEAGR